MVIIFYVIAVAQSIIVSFDSLLNLIFVDAYIKTFNDA